MCGIVGYVGKKQVVPVIIDGLRRLEYRGYDSAGIAVAGNGEGLQVRRAEGKLRNLEEVIRLKPLDGTYGIGHTRWATHGRPTEENAHPHRDCTGKIVVVHNGIVENYRHPEEAAASKKATSSSPRPTPRSSRTWSRSTWQPARQRSPHLAGRGRSQDGASSSDWRVCHRGHLRPTSPTRLLPRAMDRPPSSAWAKTNTSSPPMFPRFCITRATCSSSATAISRSSRPRA